MMFSRRSLLASLAALPLAGCAGRLSGRAGVVAETFGTLPDGQPVTLYTLTNGSGASLRAMTYGASVTNLVMPDKAGTFADIVLGLDDFESYRIRSRNFGTLVGRYAGRIGNGRFPLDGREVRLETGGSKHSSHGGPDGFAKRNWHAQPLDGAAVRMTLLSADGDQGFPGELAIAVTYRLTPDNRFRMEIEAVTTKPTVLNPTHHGYFNLSGVPGSLVHDHVLTMEADGFTAFGPDKMVTGDIRPVAGTALDFRTPKPIGRDIASTEEQMRIGGGYDHCFVIRSTPDTGPRKAARLEHPGSGRVMELWTTEPGVQLFTANGVNMAGRGGAPYKPHCGVCLEPQHFQNSPNQPGFPGTVLRPGQRFRSVSEYRFGVA
ncbi:aldose epimerase family protein [Niveispirillum sp. KHB5.9]|uniref:aldose epimerase family protein n=1 Tax=Niveispirillum sp. KHB5.9 TaxID=3400269 RepID=UPI003A88CFEC